MGAPSLAEDFQAATAEQWRALAAAVLARSGVGADADPVAALSTTRSDGITLLPLYTAADAPPARSSGVERASAWDVRARHADPDPRRTNAAVLADLERGATSL